MSDIVLGVSRHAALAVRLNPAHAQAALRSARHALGYGLCECVTPARRLVIRERAGSLHLAVWPQDGPQHDAACVFYREPDAGSGLSAYSGHALKEATEGFTISAAFSLSRSLRQQSPSPPVEPPPGLQSRVLHPPPRTCMPLLGVLHYLWDQSSLNRWAKGWKRNYWRVVRELGQVADHGHIAGHALAQCLYVPPPFRPDRAREINAGLDAFLATLQRSTDSASSGLMLGRVTGMQGSQYGHRLSLAHMPLPVYVRDDVQQSLARRYARCLWTMSLGCMATTQCVGLLHVERTPRGHLQLLDAALMVVTQDFIPVDSICEARVALDLVARNRTFCKPMHYGAKDGLPSFVLLDTAPPTCMEVCALETGPHLSRLQGRQRQHAAAGRAVWVWWASSGQAMPDLPPPRRRASREAGVAEPSAEQPAASRPAAAQPAGATPAQLARTGGA